MAKSTLTTINQIMSIASKAHYLNGGNASKILAKDKKGIFTIEQVAETLNCDPVELKTLLQQQGIMCGDYVIVEEFGDGEKLSTFALRKLSDNLIKKPQQQNNKKSLKDAPIPVLIISFIITLYAYNWLFNPDVVELVLVSLITALYLVIQRIK